MISAQEHLTKKGIHSSHQRIAIMDYLLKNCTHPTAEEIYSALSPKMPTLSLTTVYNTLKLFAEHNAVQAINIEGKNTRYDACTEPHAHFQCTRCGKVFDIPLPTHAMCSNNPHLSGFEIQSTQIYHKGLCPQCADKTHN